MTRDLLPMSYMLTVVHFDLLARFGSDDSRHHIRMHAMPCKHPHLWLEASRWHTPIAGLIYRKVSLHASPLTRCTADDRIYC